RGAAERRDRRFRPGRPPGRRDASRHEGRRRAAPRLSDALHRLRELAGWEGRRAAKPVGHRAEDLDRDLAVLIEDVADLRVPEDEAAHRGRRANGRRARSVVEEGDLAEELTRPEHPLSRGRLDLRLALENDEEIAAALALLAEDATGRKVHLLNPGEDETELFVAATREERDRPKPRDASVRHARSLSAAMPRAYPRRRPRRRAARPSGTRARARHRCPGSTGRHGVRPRGSRS